MIHELIDCAINMSRPRPWLVNNQIEELASGTQSAATVNPPKITAASPHFGPNNISTTGRESAASKAVKKHPTKAMASYTRKNVDRYRSGWDWRRESAGMKTALIGLRNCSKGRISRAVALE